MPSDVEIEISKLLHSSFNGGTAEPISMRDLARMWSLEMPWFSPDGAHSLASRLHDSGWLVGEEEFLRACPSCFQHPPELGWRPFLSRVGDIPSPPTSSTQILGTLEESSETENSNGSDTQSTKTKDEDGIGKLVSRVSSMSGLDKREVIRRAERKRRALGPVTIEVAVLLLAREQNLEMDELVELV